MRQLEELFINILKESTADRPIGSYYDSDEKWKPTDERVEINSLFLLNVAINNVRLQVT